jgi:hypothetical protein
MGESQSEHQPRQKLPLKSMTTSNEIKRGSGRRAPHKSKEPQKKKPKEDLNITKYFNCNQLFQLKLIRAFCQRLIYEKNWD